MKQVAQEQRVGADKRASGMLFVLSTCKTPGKGNEFQQWYVNTHIPDVLSTDQFLGATFWRADPASPSADPTFIAMYETTKDKLPRVMEVIKASVPKWHGAGRGNPELKVIHTGMYQKLAAWDGTTKSKAG